MEESLILLDLLEECYLILLKREEGFHFIDLWNEIRNGKIKVGKNLENLFFSIFPFLPEKDIFESDGIYGKTITQIDNYFKNLLIPFISKIDKIVNLSFSEILDGNDRENFEFEIEIPSQFDNPSLENYSNIFQSYSILLQKYNSYFSQPISTHSTQTRQDIIFTGLSIVDHKFIMEKIKSKLFGKNFIGPISLPSIPINRKRCVHGKNKDLFCRQCEQYIPNKVLIIDDEL